MFDTTLGVLGARNGTQTDCRGSDATCKQGLQTNSWSSNRIMDIYSLPVAPLALPKCSSIFYVHGIDLEPRGKQVGSCRILRLKRRILHVYWQCGCKSANASNSPYYILLHNTYATVTPTHFLIWHAMSQPQGD